MDCDAFEIRQGPQRLGFAIHMGQDAIYQWFAFHVSLDTEKPVFDYIGTFVSAYEAYDSVLTHEEAEELSHE